MPGLRSLDGLSQAGEEVEESDSEGEEGQPWPEICRELHDNIYDDRMFEFLRCFKGLCDRYADVRL